MTTELLPLVKEVQTDWEYGWKGARLMIDTDLTTLRFRALGHPRVTYGVDEEAECHFRPIGISGPLHEAPAQGCRCGFNAWQDHRVAIDYFTQEILTKYTRKARSKMRRGLPVRRLDDITLLRVGLKGRIIEGTLDAGDGWEKWGYRAAHQRVGEIFLHETCIGCGRLGTKLFARKEIDHFRTSETGRRMDVLTLCKRHRQKHDIPLNKKELAAQNDVSLYWGRPSG